MKKLYVICMPALLAALIFASTSCTKNPDDEKKTYLGVDLPYLDHQTDYWTMDYNARSVELQFNSIIDTNTIRNNITFYDESGSLDTCYTLLALEDKILMLFKPQVTLMAGWQYKIDIKTGLRSVSGLSFSSTKTLDIRTKSLLLGQSEFSNTILCISDIHLGEERAVNEGYCWFTQNDTALENLLDTVIRINDVKQLVILGDLFDGWIIPYHSHMFDASQGVTDITTYFKQVANSPKNLPVINRLRAIASGGKTELIYIPGNHDMLLTQSVLEEIIPGIKWKGDANGLGHYSPVEGIIMEHGHRYDLFNAPEPLVNPGHILPPGFFVSRLQAEVSKHNAGLMQKQSGSYLSSDTLFHIAWGIAIDFLEIQGQFKINRDSMNIIMDGVDGYADNFSFNSARAMYYSTIESKWGPTQVQNQVPVNIRVAQAIFNSDVDLDITAKDEYMKSSAPVKYDIVVMGHTHKPELEYYSAQLFTYTGIYANTGSWVDDNVAGNHQNRTFILIRPGQWTGSALDIVSLYQFSKSADSWTELKTMSVTNL